MDIQFYNRHTGEIEREKVYGDAAVKWLYQSQSGKLLSRFIASPLVSTVYGMLQDSSQSRRKIPKFVETYGIEMNDFLPQAGRPAHDPYESFNQFFIRALKPGAREFVSDSTIMPAFCEARYYGHERVDDDDTKIPVKGAFLRSKDLVVKNKWAGEFQNGPFLVARLCPVDYHRFHFPDKAKVLDSYPLHGALHSVNPIALKERPNIFITNKREVSILETQNFGLLAYIEVGATCVGKIVNTYTGADVERGQEKGYFLFGGSTVVVLGQPGKWRPCDEILKYTEKGMEVYSRLGHEIAKI